MVAAFVGLFSATAIFYLLFGACHGPIVGILPALGGAA